MKSIVKISWCGIILYNWVLFNVLIVRRGIVSLTMNLASNILVTISIIHHKISLELLCASSMSKTSFKSIFTTYISYELGDVTEGKRIADVLKTDVDFVKSSSVFQRREREQWRKEFEWEGTKKNLGATIDDTTVELKMLKTSQSMFFSNIHQRTIEAQLSQLRKQKKAEASYQMNDERPRMDIHRYSTLTIFHKMERTVSWPIWRGCGRWWIHCWSTIILQMVFSFLFQSYFKTLEGQQWKKLD